ncbi:MAG: transcriptional regulator NrdR [Thermacetogeniaceae bacterium]
MRCPYCKNGESRVLDSRLVEMSNEVRRRRECLLCGRRFTTYERIEEPPLWVVKKDGRRELFDREKLLRGIMKACEKRHATLETLSLMVDEIERELRDRAETEVSSQVIGHMVMDRLRKVDKVAYVRFASVYREFKDVEEILSCLEELGIERKQIEDKQ